MSDFWWRNKKESKGIHWRSWEQLSKPKFKGGLGFKDLEAFNLALLGKQLWRMLVHKESLLARVLKSRYFAKSEPLSASLGSRPSYAWRSIHSAQKLLQQGARVLIGDGQSTKVFQDLWIGQNPASSAQAIQWNSEPQRHHPPHNLRVSQLLLNEGREWNMELLSNYFPEDLRRRILQTRTCGKNSEDTYVWDYTKTGLYSVKSGYWVLTNILNSMEKAEADQPSLDYLYQLAWNTDTSPKIHHFLWRCINNIVPVAGNMARKHLSKDARCYRCDFETETINHMLFQCPLARLVWALSPIPDPPGGVMVKSLFSNIYHVLTVQSKYPNDDVQAEIAPWLMWRLWKSRNELIYNGREQEAAELVRRAKEDAEEWRGRKIEETKKVESSEVQISSNANHPNPWQPPPKDWLKCNSDGAWRKDRETSGLGWICRDERGEVRWVGARSVTRARSAIVTEAEAMKWSAETLANFGYKNIVFETDSRSLAQMVNGSEEVWPILKPTIEVIRHYLSRIGSYMVRFYPRGGNKAADRVAKESITFVSSIPKLYSIVPLWLKYQVRTDKTVHENMIW